MAAITGPYSEIQTGTRVSVVTFSADSKHIISGGEGGVRVWRVEEGHHWEVGAMETGWDRVLCLAVSQNGRWIAAGTDYGYLHVWDAATHEQVFQYGNPSGSTPRVAVDFSSDSTQVAAAFGTLTATVWDVETAKQVQTLRHKDPAFAVKYSPHGNRIATATRSGSVRVWDSSDGSLLIEFPASRSEWRYIGLVWFDHDHLLVSDGNIKELDVSAGSTVVWPVPGTPSFIALLKRGKTIVYCTTNTNTVTLASRHCLLGQFECPRQPTTIACSSDGRLLAASDEKGSVIIQRLSRFAPISPSRLHTTLQEPVIQVDTAVMDSLKCGRFETADQLLTTANAATRTPNHHVLACRALVRVRLRKWDIALADAQNAIKIEPSVIAYIAKSIAHVGSGDSHQAYRSIDIAIERFHSSHVTFLLLVKAVIASIAGEYIDAISRMDDLITTVPRIPLFYIIQACGIPLGNYHLNFLQAYMYLLLGKYQMTNKMYDNAIRSFTQAREKLPPCSSNVDSMISLISGWEFGDLDITISQQLCEALYSAKRINDAGSPLFEMVDSLEEEMYMCPVIFGWISGFTRKCLSDPIAFQDTDMAPPYTKNTRLLREWARATLTNHSWRDALATTVNFITPKFVVYQTIYERLDATGRITDASECLVEMAREMSQDTMSRRQGWMIDLRGWCSGKLKEVGDLAMNSQQYDYAITRYSAALSLDPPGLHALLAKRSKAYAIIGSWKDALDDANQITILDPSSPLGYERKYAALRVAGSYCDAEVAFETMLSKMSMSTNSEIRERSHKYVKPAETEAAIREAVQHAIRESPLVLINTHTGRLLDKPSQASSFELRPIFHDLVCSTTTSIDRSRIEDEVGQYYRYAMFSHKWESREPVYNDVIDVIVYELEAFPTHEKLQKFCKIVRKAGLHWAWSDTVCINKSDPSVLQEALVSMFRWYQSSTLTVILLCESPWKCLVENIWNQRAWTLQEYHASKVVQFYNHDWTLYRGIEGPNHKEAPEVIAEMEQATGISAQGLVALRPGLEDIREKLRLASTRQATRVEDLAYSLLGIFSLSMTIEYGEGDKALGRLLAQLLMSSGDTSILAWTGGSGSFNSCLPGKLAVFSHLPTTHIPSSMADVEMETITSWMRKASLNASSVSRFYDRLYDLPIPSFNGRRMKLPSITFKLGPLSVSRNGSERVFRGQTNALGIVEIKTEEDLANFGSLTLVYPWIDFLLDRQPVGSTVDTIAEEGTEDQSSFVGELPSHSSSSNVPSTSFTTRTRLASRFGLPFGRRSADAGSLLPPSTVTETDKKMYAFRVLARLRQPFGALLFAADPGNVSAYKRVAAESLITVQVQEITPAILDALIRGVRVLDVL